MMSKSKRGKRQALTKTNLSYLQWRYFDNAMRTMRAWQSQKGYGDHAKQVAEQILDHGIVVGPADSYLSGEGRKALAEASAQVLALSESGDVKALMANGNQADSKDYLVRLVPWEQQHAPDSPLLRLALDRKLLEIVSAYLGMWPRLHAIGAWLNFPTEHEAKEAQLWHRDPEDMKIVKVFVYLNNVGMKNGPFCYIPKTHPFSSGAGTIPIHKDKKRILDDEMVAALPQDRWMACTGPANTMILADTVGYHRGGKPTEGTRLLITFTYTSGTPFSKRVLSVTDRPAWLDHPMQSYAL
jgi:hypothetical protein